MRGGHSMNFDPENPIHGGNKETPPLFFHVVVLAFKSYCSAIFSLHIILYKNKFHERFCRFSIFICGLKIIFFHQKLFQTNPKNLNSVTFKNYNSSHVFVVFIFHTNYFCWQKFKLSSLMKIVIFFRCASKLFVQNIVRYLQLEWFFVK